MTAKVLCTIKSVDHLVLTVASLPRTISFYQMLGMKHQMFNPSSGPSRHSLNFGQSKINLHQHGNEFEPKARQVQPGSADLCFVIEEPVDQVKERLEGEGLTILEGGKVVTRTGALGSIMSVYVRDPDGNLIELSNYAIR